MRHRARLHDPAAAQGPGVVLDAGALQAIEGRHLALFAALDLAHERKLPIRIPAAALAQAWRGGPRCARLARLLKQPCDVVAVNEPSARQVGEFIAALQPDGTRRDVVDAHVALITRATGSLVWTSDPDDMARYGVDERHVRRV